MQERAISQYIPLISSQAGSCLTFANWQNAGIRTIAYRLDELLVKPGLPVLEKLTELRNYVSWPGEIVINAQLPAPNSQGVYKLRSAYDGQKIEISIQNLAYLIKQLRPNKVLLPVGSSVYFEQFWQPLIIDMELYLYQEESLKNIQATGYYSVYTEGPFNHFFNGLQGLNSKPYIIGNFQLQDMGTLLQNNYSVQSNQPAEDGMMGLFYNEGEKINILLQSLQHDYQTLQYNCQCQTCRAQLTRAYLHHLLQQTPLLAQRYLIEHNVHYCQNYLINQN